MKVNIYLGTIKNRNVDLKERMEYLITCLYQVFTLVIVGVRLFRFGLVFVCNRIQTNKVCFTVLGAKNHLDLIFHFDFATTFGLGQSGPTKKESWTFL